MKTDANGNEVYFGYTLIKPERKGELWRIVNAAQTTVDSATTRSEARNAVKNLLDGPSESEEKRRARDERDEPFVEPDAHTIESHHVRKAELGVSAVARESVRSLAAVAEPIVDENRWHAPSSAQDVRTALAPALNRVLVKSTPNRQAQSPATILFRLDGGVACGRIVSGPDSNGHRIVCVMSSQRSPRRIGEEVTVEHDGELTAEQVERYYRAVKAARKGRKRGWALGNVTVRV